MVPIIIGITGHRDLREEDISDLEKKVRGIFQEIRGKYPSSPIKVLSPLADGADRLVAKVGLDMVATLTVVLPMPRSEYEKDFETEESKREFAALLAQAEDVYELPLLEGKTLENIQGYDEPRNKQYAYVGAYVALHSQILIALWNGKKSGKTGGTSDIVRYKLEGVPEPYAPATSPLDLSDNGPVYHIFTQRKQTEVTQNNHSPDVDWLVKKGDDNGWDVIYPAGWKGGFTEKGAEIGKDEAIKNAGKYYDGLLKRIDEFNCDVKSVASSDKVKTQKSYILPEDKQVTLMPGLSEVLNILGNGDVTAIHFQARVDKALKWLLSAPVIAFFFFGAFDELWSMVYMLSLFPVFFGIAYIIYKYTAKKEYDRKFSDYRVLAEGLRVQFFWKLAGMRENVTDHYHRKYKAEMNWIFYAIRNVSIKANMEVLKQPASDIKQKLETVKDRWIENQNKYFKDKAGIRKKWAEDAEKFTTRFFVIAMVFVLGIFSIKGFLLIQQNSLENIMNMEDIKDWKIYSVLLVLIDTFIAIGAARAVYVEKKGFNEEAKQFQRMKDLFQKGSNVMIECLKKDDLKGAEKLVIELGKEALTENGDWLLLRRSKPMEVPLG